MPEKKVTTSSNQNLLAALTYFLGFITGIIFLLLERDNKFIRFHAMQSVIVFGAIFVINMVLQYVPVMGGLLGTLVSIISFILWIVLMIKAYKGEHYKLPYAGDLAEQYMGKIK